MQFTNTLDLINLNVFLLFYKKKKHFDALTEYFVDKPS